MTANRLWTCGLDADQVHQFNNWVFDKTGFMENEVSRISIIDEGVIEVERLILGRGGYVVDKKTDELVRKVDTVPVSCLPPFLDRFEIDRVAS